jgi:hypothetical protein
MCNFNFNFNLNITINPSFGNIKISFENIKIFNAIKWLALIVIIFFGWFGLYPSIKYLEWMVRIQKCSLNGQRKKNKLQKRFSEKGFLCVLFHDILSEVKNHIEEHTFSEILQNSKRDLNQYINNLFKIYQPKNFESMILKHFILLLIVLFLIGKLLTIGLGSSLTLPGLLLFSTYLMIRNQYFFIKEVKRCSLRVNNVALSELDAIAFLRCQEFLKQRV